MQNDNLKDYFHGFLGGMLVLMVLFSDALMVCLP